MAEGAGNGWEEIPAIQDKEVSEPKEDRFGHRDLEVALRGLLESEGHEPPYSVGLLGRWGSGKSTVRALYEERLADDAGRSRRVRTISFDAWRFGKEEVKRALLRHVFLELGGDDSDLRDELYRQVQRHSMEDRSVSEIAADIRALWGAVGLQFVLLLSGVLVIAVALVFLLGIDTALARGLVVAAALASLPLLARYLLNPVPWRANVTRLDLPSTTAEQYEEFLKGRLVAHGNENPGVERLVVFVDDLDRLPAEDMVDGLDAVRGFMDIPGEAEGGTPGVVFVISCDEGKVAEALADRRRRNDSELPATITGKEDARRYLDRIFQFRLEVPPPPKRDMRGYAKGRLREDLALVANDLEDRGVSLDAVVDRMIHPGVQSPRTAVHILNAFARSWWLSRRRERIGGATRPGGLREGAVTDHPQTLAALAALQVDFPEFYDDLEDRPGLLDAFSDVFVDGRPLGDQPTGLHDTLEGYRLASQGDDATGNLVKPRYRSLRSFVSGLRGLRRPKNLRPLIELAQDQLSRDLGPREEEARAAFVEADRRGVLESLGRANDDGPLTADQVARLKDVVEDTEGETPARRDNGGVVLAEIADRLPPERERELLDPLAFRLCNSRDLRSRVGVARIASLIPKLRRDDQVDLAGTLVEDALKTEGDVSLETPNLQTPSLEDAIGIARASVEAALAVRERFGLSPASDEALLEWLAVRRASSGGESYEFPFSDLEAWVAEHENNLLPALGARYTAMVAAAIGAGALGGVQTAETARRSREIFARLAAGGRQDHAVLWDHLTAFVSADDLELARAGWEFAAADTSTADPERASSFVGTLADRAFEAGENHEERGATAPGAGAALVAVYRSLAGNVEDEAQQKVAELARFWGRAYYDEETGRNLGGYAADLTEALAGAESDHFAKVLGDWSGLLLGELGPTCRRWVASFVPNLNEAERANVVQGLAEVSTANSVEEDMVRKYAEFVSALDANGLRTEEISNHLGEVAQRAADLTHARGQVAQIGSTATVSQAEIHLARVLPVLAPVLAYVPAENAGAMLERAFVDGGYADHAHPMYARLHGAMVGRWPSSEDVPYSSESVFDGAEKVAKESPQIDDAPALIRSMASVAARDGLGAGFSRRSLDAACVLWPHHQEFVLETITANEEPASPGALASLAAVTDPDDAEQGARLRNAWEHCAGILSAQGLTEVARLLVGRAPDEEASDPDWALGLWLRAVPGPDAVLRTYFENPEAVDEDLARLWGRALREAERLGPPFFREVLPQLYAREEIEKTISAIASSKQRVTDLFDGPAAKNELGRGLLEALVASPRNSDKGFLAQWIDDAGSAGSLGHLNNLDPTEGDLEILKEVFSDKKIFQNYLHGRRGR